VPPVPSRPVRTCPVSIDALEPRTFLSGAPVVTVVTTPVSATDDVVQASAAQPDGKILLAGLSTGPDGVGHIALARYDAAGAIDATFGAAGRVVLDGREDNADILHVAGVAPAPGGKIVVVGAVHSGYVAYRLNADGSLDPTFSTNGLITTDAGSAGDDVYAVAARPDGKVTLAGTTPIAGRPRFALATYVTRLD